MLRDQCVSALKAERDTLRATLESTRDALWQISQITGSITIYELAQAALGALPALDGAK